MPTSRPPLADRARTARMRNLAAVQAHRAWQQRMRALEMRMRVKEMRGV